MKRILFICTGNICRSPTAEAVARHYIVKNNLANKFIVDSAGTYGFHAGEAPDERSRLAGEKRGIDFSGIKARQITKQDFTDFDLILAMDRGHWAMLKAMCPEKYQNKIHMFLEDNEVGDPYYGGEDGFEDVLDLIEKRVEGIMNEELGMRN